LDASAALWNEANYQRLMRYSDENGFESGVWDDHDWSESPRSYRPNEQRTDSSTVQRHGNVASGET